MREEFFISIKLISRHNYLVVLNFSNYATKLHTKTGLSSNHGTGQLEATATDDKLEGTRTRSLNLLLVNVGSVRFFACAG